MTEVELGTVDLYKNVDGMGVWYRRKDNNIAFAITEICVKAEIDPYDESIITYIRGDKLVVALQVQEQKGAATISKVV